MALYINQNGKTRCKICNVPNKNLRHQRIPEQVNKLQEEERKENLKFDPVWVVGTIGPGPAPCAFTKGERELTGFGASGT